MTELILTLSYLEKTFFFFMLFIDLKCPPRIRICHYDVLHVQEVQSVNVLCCNSIKCDENTLLSAIFHSCSALSCPLCSALSQTLSLAPSVSIWPCNTVALMPSSSRARQRCGRWARQGPALGLEFCIHWRFDLYSCRPATDLSNGQKEIPWIKS